MGTAPDMQLEENLATARKKLEEYTGIEARSYTAYQFFDAAGDFIGNSDEIALEELLEKAGIEVTDDGM